ncbi:MAG: hypothetical protein PHT02_11750 [Tissierellia bacterium]|nr:hypothetical protein [Tissierellia bacterium]
MNKREYKKQFINVPHSEFQELFKKIDSMTNSNRKKLIKNIEKNYKEKFKNNLNFWISMMDYCEHIQNIEKSKQIMVTQNKEFIEFIELLKERINSIEILDITDFDKQ